MCRKLPRHQLRVGYRGQVSGTDDNADDDALCCLVKVSRKREVFLAGFDVANLLTARFNCSPKC